MRTGKETLYDEIVSVLYAEYECAESLQATSSEIQSLIDEEKFVQVQERLFSRGEVVELMMSLDCQLAALLARQPQNAIKEGWEDVLGLAGRLRELITSVMGMDRVSQAKLEESCKDIGERLNVLQKGRKLARSYGLCFERHIISLMYA